MLRPRTIVAGALLCAPLLAGCGDDSSATSGESSSSSGSSSVSAGSPSSAASTGEGGGEAPAGTGGSGGEPGAGGGGGGGGGEPTAIDDVFRSGSRLRAVIEDGGGDARRLLRWHDVELGIDCVASRDTGGVQRCLPEQRALYYVDDGCTQLATRPWTECFPGVDYLVVQVSSEEACNADDGRHYDGYRVIGDAGVPEIVYSLGGSGNCSPSFNGNTLPMQLVEPIDIETFAVFEESVEIIDGDVARRVHASEDGAFQVVSGFDRTREVSCGLFDPGDGSGLVCLEPTNRRHSGFAYWSDQTCGEPAVPIFQCDDPTRPVIDFELDECGERLFLREPGAAFEGHLHESFGGNDECIPQENTFGIGVGAEIAPSSYPSLGVIALEGDGMEMRLSARGGRSIVGSGGFRLSSGTTCYAAEVGDGTARCIPYPLATDLGQFSDPDCTEPLARIGYGGLDCWDYQMAGVYTEVDACSDDVLTGLFELGETHRGAVYELVDGACVEFELGLQEFAPIGASVPFDSLPLIELRVE